MIQLILKTIILSIVLTLSETVIVKDQSQPPENEIRAQEQLFLNPIKRYRNEGLTCGQLITNKGFLYKEHKVITPDGYILTLYEIINPFLIGKKLKPVLLIHGIFQSCGTWMLHDDDGYAREWIDGVAPNVTSNDLAFVLANGGYSVWLGNNRGTIYSIKHLKLNAETDPEYWDFSLDEFAKYDDPTMIDYVRNQTGYKEIVYMGHSQGGIHIMFALSESQHVRDSLALTFVIYPIAYAHSFDGVFGILPHFALIYKILGLINGPFPPFFIAEIDAAISAFCQVNLLNPICLEIVKAIFGESFMIKGSIVPVLTSQIDHISVKILNQLDQGIEKDHFTKFDYGEMGNIEHYNSSEPPIYNYENIPSDKLVLISSDTDAVARPYLVQKFRNSLKKRAKVDHEVQFPVSNHVDVLLGSKANQYIHQPILNILRENY